MEKAQLESTNNQSHNLTIEIDPNEMNKITKASGNQKVCFKATIINGYSENANGDIYVAKEYDRLLIHNQNVEIDDVRVCKNGFFKKGLKIKICGTKKPI